MHEIIIRLILLTAMIAVCATVVHFARWPARLRARSRADQRAHARAIAQAAEAYRRGHIDPTRHDGASRAAPPANKR